MTLWNSWLCFTTTMLSITYIKSYIYTCYKQLKRRGRSRVVVTKFFIRQCMHVLCCISNSPTVITPVFLLLFCVWMHDLTWSVYSFCPTHFVCQWVVTLFCFWFCSLFQNLFFTFYGLINWLWMSIWLFSCGRFESTVLGKDTAQTGTLHPF